MDLALRQFLTELPLIAMPAQLIAPQAGHSSDRSWHSERTHDEGWHMICRALRLQSAWAHDNLGTLADVLLAPEFRSRHITP